MDAPGEVEVELDAVGVAPEPVPERFGEQEGRVETYVDPQSISSQSTSYPATTPPPLRSFDPWVVRFGAASPP